MNTADISKHIEPKILKSIIILLKLPINYSSVALAKTKTNTISPQPKVNKLSAKPHFNNIPIEIIIIANNTMSDDFICILIFFVMLELLVHHIYYST